MPSKKKKPAANPARGFATTSIAKKVPVKEPEPEAEKIADESKVSTSSIEQAKQAAEQVDQALAEGQEIEVRESPEEFERRLEEEELQLLLEKYGPQTQRIVDRHINKLSTDFRVLRGHAQPLSVKALLPEDLVVKLLGLAQEDVNDASTFSPPSVRKSLQEDEITSRIWTLQRSLKSLGFNDEQIERALNYALKLFPAADKDSPVWALEQCIDWLVLSLSDEELPVYDQQSGKTQEEIPEQYNEAAVDVSAKSQKGPRHKTSNEAVSSSAHIASTTAAPSDDETSIDVSDLESDLEPDELLVTYLSTKTKLYETQPELFSSGKSKGKQNLLPPSSSVSTAVKKLQAKLQKIEMDVLFDSHEADVQWTMKRNQIAQDVSERRRMQLPERSIPTKTPSKPAAAPSKTVQKSKVRSLTAIQTGSSDSSDASDDEAEDTPESDDDDNTFSDLFGALAPEEPTRAGTTTTNVRVASGSAVTIINYGQFQGLSPWRVLEETCRSRDSRATFAYKLVSESAFCNRHALTITWSKDQDLVLPLKLDSVASSQTARTSSFTMLIIATPDESQSKAYISTVALFQIFSTSVREEKAYTRLPTAFKDLYLSFVSQKERETEAADLANFKNLRELVRMSAEEDDDEDEKEDVVLTKNFKQRNNDTGKNNSRNNDDLDVATRQQKLKDIWAHKSNTPAFQRMYQFRQQLPMHRFKAEALSIIEQNQVTILCGETGCGKSTQLPSFVLEHELMHGRPCKIYCTEPRRISAITLAQRVAEELGEHRTDVGTMRSLIGYAIRLESQVTSNTKLVFATTGIVLRMLESQDGFQDVTHVIVDEVHERSIETDFLLIILRSLIEKRPKLKVVLMSATVDSVKFSKYFNGAPVITVPGRTFPVETKFLEDAIELTGYTNNDDNREIRSNEDDLDGEEQSLAVNGKPVDPNYWKHYSPRTRSTISSMDEYRINYDLIVSLVNSVAFDPQLSKYSQAILVFLPGIQEIRRLSDLLHGTPLAQGFIIHALHSALTSDEQQAAFALPPQGMRKIVISTNIAETGVTIPDITCVIDTGKHKEMRFDERRQISRLIESFISRANAKQRRGRAGRVQEGLCFHLFTKARHDEQIAEQQTPEMLRLSLQDLIMRVKICKLGDIQSTLAEALDPPSAKNIRRAIDALIEVGALTSGEELTVLGNQLSKLPLDPYLGKLVLYGALFGCLDVSLTIAAMLTSKSPFVTPMGARAQSDAARTLFKKGDSDLLTEYNAYSAWRRVCSNATGSQYSQESQFCRKNMLSPQTLGNIEDLKAQLMSAVADGSLVKLTGPERSTLSRISNSAHHRNRTFVQVPPTHNTNSQNTDLITSTIAWSFYPKLLVRDGKGWRNIATNQSISIHPTSILRSSALPNSIKYLSFYSIMQSSGGAKNYNANSLTPVHPLALVLMAGEATWHQTSGVVSVDASRMRFWVEGWKVSTAVKFLRERLQECVERKWRRPELPLPRRLGKWWEVWEEVVRRWEKKEG